MDPNDYLGIFDCLTSFGLHMVFANLKRLLAAANTSVHQLSSYVAAHALRKRPYRFLINR